MGAEGVPDLHSYVIDNYNFYDRQTDTQTDISSQWKLKTYLNEFILMEPAG